MKSFIYKFCKRGLFFAWGGPVVTAIVWAILYANGTIKAMEPPEILRGIVSSTMLAFIVAGITILNQMENLPKIFSFLIQGIVFFWNLYGVLPSERIYPGG